MRIPGPGRGPTISGPVMSIVSILFGVFWIGTAVSSGAPAFGVLFGVIPIFLGGSELVVALKKIARRNRSASDMFENPAEPDDIQEWIDSREKESYGEMGQGGERAYFCPYCGKQMQKGFTFCAHCGKRLP